LRSELAGVREGEEPEHLHQARVASRRLRVALEVFEDCFPAKKARKWRKAVRRLLKTLGPARDKDVQIEFIGGVLAGLRRKEARAGIARLLLRLRQERAAVQPAVVKEVQRVERDRLAGCMLVAAKALAAGVARTEGDIQAPPVLARVGREIQERLEALIARQDCLQDASLCEQHHAMRIAAKRFRYGLEIGKPVFESRLDAAIAAARTIQTLLGDVHDCDLWVERLEAFLEEERERTVRYYGHERPFARLRPGIEHLCKERSRHRRTALRRLAAEWTHLRDQGAWDELARLATDSGAGASGGES
jgi:CHAD domain-containing protein